MKVKIYKSCPMCNKVMKQNDWGDHVCNCQGKLHDFHLLEKMAKTNTPIANRIASIHKFRELQEPMEILIKNGVSSVSHCNDLKARGFQFDPVKQFFCKKYNHRQDADSDIQFLEDNGFTYFSQRTN